MSATSAEQTDAAGILKRCHSSLLAMTGLPAVALSCLAGMLANLGFAPFHFWPFFMLALIVLVWMLDGAVHTRRPFLARLTRAGFFALGMLGLGSSWTSVSFQAISMHDLLALHMAFVLSLALLWGMVFALSGALWRPGPSRIGLFCIAMVLAEWIRTHIYAALPWNLAGMIWAPGQAMSQTASLIGIEGLSALTIFMCVVPTACIDHRERNVSVQIAPAMIAAILAGLVWGWGAQRLSVRSERLITLAAADGGAYRVHLIDAGLAGTGAAGPVETTVAGKDATYAILDTYLALIGPDDDDAPDIIIWPEIATPHFLFQSTRFLDPIAERLGRRKLIAGSLRVATESGGGTRVYNSLAIISGESSRRGPLAIYDAYRFAPFVASLPYAQALESMGVQSMGANGVDGSLSRGLPPIRIAVSDVPPFIPLIGIESLFPSLLQKGMDRPAWLVNVARETSLGTHVLGPFQHLAHARYRCIEEGLPMARVSAGGISAMIDPYGRIWNGERASSFSSGDAERKDGDTLGVVRTSIPNRLEKTIFGRGDLAYFMLFFIIFNLGLFVWRLS